MTNEMKETGRFFAKILKKAGEVVSSVRDGLLLESYTLTNLHSDITELKLKDLEGKAVKAFAIKQKLGNHNLRVVVGLMAEDDKILQNRNKETLLVSIEVKGLDEEMTDLFESNDLIIFE